MPSKTSLSRRENQPCAHTEKGASKIAGTQVAAKHERVAQPQNAATRQANGCTTTQGPCGSETIARVVYSANVSPGAHRGPGAVPDTGAANNGRTDVISAPVGLPPAGDINLEQIIVEVQSS